MIINKKENYKERLIIMKIMLLAKRVKNKILNKTVRCKRKNYMYLHVDEVHIQKVYHSNWPFYVELLSMPTIAVVAFVVLATLKALDITISSIIIGVLGSFIASVVVTWLVEISNCKSKTMERMRFQHIYFSNLLDICSIFINCQVLCLAENFPDECKNEIEKGEYYKYFRGYPWQHWFSLFNDIIMTRHPFTITTDDGISGDWISEGSNKYCGEEFEKEKAELENEAKTIFDAYLNNVDLIDRISVTVESYRLSLPAVYANDNINYNQLTTINVLTDYMEKFANCIKEKKYIDLWNNNFAILEIINDLSMELYPFRILRENECVYHISFDDSNKVRIRSELLEAYVDDSDAPVFLSIRRSHYRRVKKQMKINESFNKENESTFDNGWR